MLRAREALSLLLRCTEPILRKKIPLFCSLSSDWLEASPDDLKKDIQLLQHNGKVIPKKCTRIAESIFPFSAQIHCTTVHIP